MAVPITITGAFAWVTSQMALTPGFLITFVLLGVGAACTAPLIVRAMRQDFDRRTRFGIVLLVSSLGLAGAVLEDRASQAPRVGPSRSLLGHPGPGCLRPAQSPIPSSRRRQILWSAAAGLGACAIALFWGRWLEAPVRGAREDDPVDDEPEDPSRPRR